MSAEIQVLPPINKDAGRELTAAEPEHASSDDHLVELWLQGRSSHTQCAYRADVTRLRAGAGKALAHATPRTRLAPSAAARRLTARE